MKKKIFSIALVLCLLASLLCVPASAAISGDGSKNNPFLITCQDELEMLSDFPDCNFKLMNDIELVGNWAPIAKEFTGTFDGCGHTISNLTVTKHLGQYCGFFYSIGAKGTVKRLHIESSDTGVYMINVSNWYMYVGGIAGRCEGRILQCSFSGNLYNNPDESGTGYRIATGGIVGYLSDCSTIEECYTKGNICSGGESYGIAYSVHPSVTIRNCYSTMSGSPLSGGIGHYATNCYFTGNGATSIGNDAKACFVGSKQQLIDAGWDFDTVWAIDPDYNDGYPYLQWERIEPDTTSSGVEKTSVAIVDAHCTEDSIKFVSYAEIKETDTVSAFGTIFIPAWLFTDPDVSPVVAEYDANENPIKNGNTFGATLGKIPDGYQDMLFIGKSYLKLSDGSYIWSNAKKVSIDNPVLRKVEE